MAYKGVLPSDLWEKYDCEGGQDLMMIDLLVAMDIHDKISSATTKAKDGNAMVARRKQRQAKRELLSDGDGLAMLKGLGIPIAKRSE
tara:strand:- start:761 stop:1021 length:261 start_codon:yes stop_codon:yes gene_type:complete